MAQVYEPLHLAAGAEDPLVGFRFWVEMESVIEGMFLDCTGLSMEREVVPYQEGGVNDHWHFLPGRTKQSHLTLKHGVILSPALWNWYQEGLYTGAVKRVAISIILCDGQYKQVRRWNVCNAWPIKWTGPELKADSSQVAVETIEIAHDGFTLQASEAK